MTPSEISILNSMQLVLRGLTQSLAAAGSIDPAKAAYLLQSFATSYAQGQDRIAHAMLLDLAEGLDVIAQATQGRTAGN